MPLALWLNNGENSRTNPNTKKKVKCRKPKFFKFPRAHGAYNNQYIYVKWSLLFIKGYSKAGNR